MLKKIAVAVGLGIVVMGFQNCGKASDSKVAFKESASASADGNSLSTASGQKISFINVLGDPLGDVNATSVQGDVMLVNLVHPTVGRKATVKVTFDPVTHNILSVTKTNKAFMCFDATKDYCAQIPIPSAFGGSGQMGLNCSSPIIFTGSVNGAIDGITQTADQIYCKQK